MEFSLRILLLLFLIPGTLTQDFDLFDALGGDPTKAPEKPKIDEEKPKKPSSGDSGGLDLFDALGPDAPQTEKPKKPSSGDSGGFDLEDALKPDPNPKPDKPVITPPKSGGGGRNFDESDLFDVSQGDYKPDGGRSGGRMSDPGSEGGDEQPQGPDLLWGQILKRLNTNMPEEFYMWISNIKQMLTPLLERAMELLQAIP